MEINERVKAVLTGNAPDKVPFISRMDFWYGGLTFQDIVPEKYLGMSLNEVHRSTGLGHEEWKSPCAFRYKNLELVMYRDGEKILHEHEPVIDFFPDLWGLVPVDREGEIITDLVTPIGKLTSSHRVIKGSLSSGVTRLNLIKHPIVDPDDFNIYQYLIEHSEFVPQYEEFFKRSEELGGSGFLVPTLNRVPFQSVLIDAMGEIACFLGLHYHPNLIDRLMAAIDQQVILMLENLSEFDYPYIEFVDNLDGVMTNPRLFREFILHSYQKYAEILHDHGKKLGSHTDGNLKILLPLLAGCGLRRSKSLAS